MTNEAGMRLFGGWRTIVGVCGAVAATGLLATMPAAADLVTRVAPSQDLSARAAQERIAAYWTPKRMVAAQPRGLKSVSSAELDHMARSDGPSGRVKPRHTVSPAAVDRALPTAFGTYEIFEYAVRPNTANGKVFGTDRYGDFECSGTVVNTANQSVVLTAGHCVHLRNYGWAHNVVFVPSYKDGIAPYGVWTYRTEVAQRNWIRKQTAKNDFAAIVVSPQANGATLQGTVGGYDLAWNQPRDQVYRVAGYPGNYYDAQRMMGCLGPFVGVERTSRSTGIRCNLGLGSSGGGWLIQDQYLNSVMSFKIKHRPNLSFGPYFRASAPTLVDYAGGL